MCDLTSPVGRGLNNWFWRRLGLVLDIIGVTLDDGTDCVFVSLGEFMQSGNTFHRLRDRLLTGFNSLFRQRSLDGPGLRTHINRGSVQPALGIAEGGCQIGPPDTRDAGVVSGTVHQVVRCLIGEVDTSERWKSFSRSGDQCSTLIHVQLYRQFGRPAGLLVKMSRASRQMQK